MNSGIGIVWLMHKIERLFIELADGGGTKSMQLGSVLGHPNLEPCSTLILEMKTFRRSFLRHAAIGTSLAALSNLAFAFQKQPPASGSGKMPVLFIGHGSPMNAISDNAFTQTLRRWGRRLPPPTAVLIVSAHWLSRSVTGVTVHEAPPTIHDFQGFPDELQQMQYPAKGHPELARRAAALIRSNTAIPTDKWGLDHGAWTVLHHLYPNASAPVFQVSIDYDKPAAFHYAVGKELAALREMGVLIIGSGNLVHNLRATENFPDGLAASRPWAQNFDQAVKTALAAGDENGLLAYESLDREARMAVPTPDHYWPFLYALGAGGKTPPDTVFEGFQRGTLGMRCLQWT